MNQEIIVSIITPSYNSSDFIEETIKSVQNQTYQNWEMLIIDDCSDDNSVDVIRKYCALDSRIKLFVLKQNSGAAVARNKGLENVKGRFIAFLDSDDLWMPHKLETQVDFMLKEGFAISFTEYQVCSENMRECFYDIEVPISIDYISYLKNTIIGMSTSMIDLERVKPFKFHNIRTRQDTYLWISLLKRGHIAYGLQEKLVKYRVRDNSISANKIKAAKRVWFLYYKLENLGLLKSTYYFMWYVFNALNKRRK